MTDWYMAQVEVEDFYSLEWGKWNDRLRQLPIGESFTVGKCSERDSILNASNRVGVKVRTRKLASGGYEIQRINSGPARRRGHPKRGQYA